MQVAIQPLYKIFIMRKVLCCIYLGVMLLGVTSCGSMKVYVSDESIYSRKTPITIIIPTEDKRGTLGELQFLLRSNGYRLISYATAKKTFNIDSDYTPNTSSTKITNSIDMKSMYALDVNYTCYDDGFFLMCKNFSATVTDLKTGEIFMTAHFRGNKDFRSLLKDLVEKMNAVIK